MHVLVLAKILMLMTMSMAACNEFEVAGKTAADVFPDPNVVDLARAAAVGDADGIDQALAAGADIHSAGVDDIYPLMWAMFAQNKAGFIRLLERGANPYRAPKGTYAALEIAAGAEGSEFLEILLDRGIDPNKPVGDDQKPPIFTAITQHRWPQVESLLAACYDINWTNEFGITAVTYAAGIGDMKMAVYLLEKGASHNLVDLAWAVETRIGEASEQYEWQQRAIAMLKERGIAFPPDRSRSEETVTPPPPSPPAYAESCEQRPSDS